MRSNELRNAQATDVNNLREEEIKEQVGKQRKKKDTLPIHESKNSLNQPVNPSPHAVPTAHPPAISPEQVLPLLNLSKRRAKKNRRNSKLNLLKT